MPPDTENIYNGDVLYSFNGQTYSKIGTIGTMEPLELKLENDPYDIQGFGCLNISIPLKIKHARKLIRFIKKIYKELQKKESLKIKRRAMWLDRKIKKMHDSFKS